MGERRAARLTKHAAIRYGLAAAATLVAGALQLRLATEPSTAFLLFYPTVLGCALWGGAGPGLLSTLLSAVLAWVVFMPNPALTEGLSLTVFTVMGVLVSLAARRLRFASARQPAAKQNWHAARPRSPN